MVFGIISTAGTGPLVRLHGKINTTVYKEILKKQTVPNLRTAINQPVVFMQDNVPCHTTKSIKIFHSVMEWPAQSPDILFTNSPLRQDMTQSQFLIDMNPIDNVWKLLNERAKETNPRNVEEL